MPAHTHWRVLFTRSNSPNTDIWLDEVSFRDAADVDLSVGGTASASASYSASFLPALAFDKTLATNGWASLTTVFPCWIAYAHPSPVEVDSVILTVSGDPSASDEMPADGSVFIQWSDNGSDWFNEGVMAYRTANDWGVGVAVRIKALAALSARSAAGQLSQLYGNRLDQSPLRATLKGSKVSRLDPIDGGTLDIDGIVRIEGSPAARRVRLFEAQSGRLLRETFSAPTGLYRFPNMRSDTEYILLADDHQRVYNAVVADKIKAAP
jgi:hypothetical protein